MNNIMSHQDKLREFKKLCMDLKNTVEMTSGTGFSGQFHIDAEYEKLIEFCSKYPEFTPPDHPTVMNGSMFYRLEWSQ